MLARSALRFSTSAGRTTLPRVLVAQHQVRTAASTTPTSNDEAYSILVAQRKQRPLAPHLSIYQPQLTWYMSAATRVTGMAIAGSAYIFGMSYAVAPLLGMHMESATIAAAVAAWPVAVKIAAKFALATPFVYHCLNGVRHLNWDLAKALDIKGVYATGYAVLGATAAGVGYLTFFV